jgi:hypothetical protein
MGAYTLQFLQNRCNTERRLSSSKTAFLTVTHTTFTFHLSPSRKHVTSLIRCTYVYVTKYLLDSLAKNNRNNFTIEKIYI